MFYQEFLAVYIPVAWEILFLTDTTEQSVRDELTSTLVSNEVVTKDQTELTTDSHFNQHGMFIFLRKGRTHCLISLEFSLGKFSARYSLSNTKCCIYTCFHVALNYFLLEILYFELKKAPNRCHDCMLTLILSHHYDAISCHGVCLHIKLHNINTIMTMCIYFPIFHR